MTEIIETTANGKHRVRLVIDQEPVNPRRDYDHLTHVITPKGQRYIDVDESGGPLQDGWDHYADRDDAAELFIRWARTFCGATVVEHRSHDGAWSLWYMTPEQKKEIGTSPEEFIRGEIQEYQRWAEGDVWGYVIEEAATWQRTETTADETMVTWEEVESSWSLIGREYAEEEARREFAPYRSEVRA